MKIIVTGGAGYIGSHTIIEIFEKTDWEVISLDNYSNSSELTYQRIKNITGKQVEYYNVDLKDFSATEKIFSAHNDAIGIIHFAAYKAVGESVEKPLTYYDNNIGSLSNILKCQQKFNISNLIFSSSCSVYGNINTLPVTEDSPLTKAESPYAYTKQIGEVMLQDFVNVNTEYNTIALRYFNPVGAHSSGKNGELSTNKPNNLVPFITQTAMGRQKKLTVFGGDYSTRDGTCVRDYIHVSDIAEAHVVALEKLILNNDLPSYDVINLGTGKGVTVLEAINAFEKVSKQKLNYEVGERREGDVENIYAENTKAKEVLGWEAKRTIDEMMLSAWKWEQYLAENNLY